MPLNIRSEEVNRLADELATRKGISKTAAVRLALINELGRAEPTRLKKLRELQEEIARHPRTGLEADKAFYDWLNDE